ncbi:Transglycosylase SLT domain-containing protein [Flavobacteriaceae bacterium MAR_2010_188]|nr:Transglycosylase SLT domain-containing protein [Flavobacteriaceae bacterium MAR_2010_188]
MNALIKLLAAVGLVSIGGFFIFATQSTTETIESPVVRNEVPSNDYNVYALSIPEKMDFAGENVPLQDPDIYERMDRELLVNTYWQSNGLLIFKRSKKYFPVIEPILKKHGIPEDFKYLAVIESGLTNAVSPAGARGVWQIMKETGKENGLEVNDNVDERYHLEKSTEVACKYLKQAKEKLGSWTLAAAAYNAGNAGVSNRLKEQKVGSYYDLLLGEETGRYLFRILALKEIINNPKKYGFNFTDKDLYSDIPTQKLMVDKPVSDFASFAKEHGINYKILKLHNPWLREDHLVNNSGKVYYIEIPEPGIYSVNP